MVGKNMKVVIVEDEVMIARRIKGFCEQILQEKLDAIIHFIDLCDAEDYLAANPIDLLLLDLNLNNHNGFDLLKKASAQAFHTIVISANTDKAIEAFEYGVLDFVAKPFSLDRLATALNRVSENKDLNIKTKFLAVKTQGSIRLLKLEDIVYIKAARQYSEVFLIDGSIALHDKNLERLLTILPNNFRRVHRSYAVSLNYVNAINRFPGTKYELELSNGQSIPLSRNNYNDIMNEL